MILAPADLVRGREAACRIKFAELHGAGAVASGTGAPSVAGLASGAGLAAGVGDPAVL